MNQYYTSLDHWPLIDSAYLTLAQGQRYLKDPTTRNGIPMPINMHTPTSGIGRFCESKFFQDLNKNFTTVRPFYGRTGPNTVYNWHVDLLGFDAGINILLSDPAMCYTLWRVPGNEHSVISDVVTCHYEPFRPVVFNSTIEHCVINLSKDYRYLLRIPVLNASYSDLRDWCMSYPANENMYN